jgi:hypothetical protein
MTDVTPGSALGDNAKFYYDTTGAEVTAWTEATVVIDDTDSLEFVTAESNCRGDAEKTMHVGKPSHKVSGTLLFKHGSGDGAKYRALRDAAHAKTVIGVAIMSADITHVGSEGWFRNMQFSKWELQRPDGDTIKVSFELVVAAVAAVGQASRYPSEYNTI